MAFLRSAKAIEQQEIATATASQWLRNPSSLPPLALWQPLLALAAWCLPACAEPCLRCSCVLSAWCGPWFRVSCVRDHDEAIVRLFKMTRWLTEFWIRTQLLCLTCMHTLALVGFTTSFLYQIRVRMYGFELSMDPTKLRSTKRFCCWGLREISIFAKKSRSECTCLSGTWYLLAQ